MRLLVAFVVLVVLPCGSAVDRELTDGQATVGTEPQTVEPAPAQGLSDDERMAQELQDEYVDTYREPHPHYLFISVHPVSFLPHHYPLMYVTSQMQDVRRRAMARSTMLRATVPQTATCP